MDIVIQVDDQKQASHHRHRAVVLVILAAMGHQSSSYRPYQTVIPLYPPPVPATDTEPDGEYPALHIPELVRDAILAMKPERRPGRELAASVGLHELVDADVESPDHLGFLLSRESPAAAASLDLQDLIELGGLCGKRGYDDVNVVTFDLYTLIDMVP